MINLHLKTAEGSFDSLITNNDLVKIPYPVISAIDDTMFNAVAFYRRCKELNKKPIIGLNAYLAYEDVDALMQRYGSFYSRLTLIARDYEGYKSLVKLSTISYKFGFFQKPRIDLKMLAQHDDGLICLIDCDESAFAKAINNDDKRYAGMIFNKLREIIDEVYFVYKPLQCKTTRDVINVVEKLSKEYEIKVIPSREVMYLDTEDKKYWEYLYAINNNTELINIEGCFNYKIFPESNKQVDNLFELIDSIEEYNLDKRELILPDMDIDNTQFTSVLLQKMEDFGFINNKKYWDRLNYELDIIMNLGYRNYFLLVSDLIEYVNSELSGYISAGRGSVGGCLIAYLLGITRVDPINPIGFDMEIPFDRFLNSGRKVMPDIDLDFLPRDRQAIIQYLGDTYGENSIKNMRTTVTYGARSSIREVCRISGKLTPDIDSILKSFPSDQHLNLELLKETDIYKQNTHNKIFTGAFEIAERLEGLPRSIGVHASGIALSASNMNEDIPFFIHNGKEITQYDQESLDYMGIIKLDILGLNILQVISDCLDMIGVNNKGKWLSNIDINDKEVYNFINEGHITGVFQWDTHNYKVVIKDVKPKNFKELVDLNSLGRSASLLSGLTDKYIARKNGIETIEPLHPTLKGLMEKTYELPLYQEQIMKIFTELANYSMVEADDVRKAMGKKIPELLDKQKQMFREKSSLSEDVVDELWFVIEKFSKYTWNLGHAMAYTRICYETAWLAYHYPKEFYCSYINNESNNDKVGDFISTLKKRGIEILNCDINISQEKYIIEDGKIYSGFIGLKFLGEKSLKKFLDLRCVGWNKLQDFDIPKNVLNKRALKSLYCAGAFDSLLKTEIDYEYFAKLVGVERNELNNLLIEQYGLSGRIAYDPSLLLAVDNDSIKDLKEKSVVFVLAYIAKIKEIYTKNGKKMAFIAIDTVEGRYETTWFPEVWKNNKMKKDQLYKLSLKYDRGIIGLKSDSIKKE